MLRATTLFIATALCAACSIPDSQFLPTDGGADSQRFVFSAASVEVGEGTSVKFTVTLARDPGATVACAVTSSTASALPVTPGTLTFSSATYATPAEVTVSAPVDANAVSETATLTFAGCGAPSSTVLAKVLDATQLRQYGWPSAFTASTTIPQGTVVAYRVNVMNTSLLDSFGVFVPAASGDFRMALYANTSNAPGALVAQMPARRALANGSNTADITPDVMVGSGDYWLVLRVGQSTAVGYSAAGVTGSQCLRNIDLPSLDDPWPTSFGAATCTTDRLLNLWTNHYFQP